MWRHKFPIYNSQPHLIYLDNAATTQRVTSVLETMHRFSIEENANVHRGIYDLSSQATHRFEEVREKVAQFINAESKENIGFTRGTTESINVIAKGYLEKKLSKGDNIIVSILEHHANFLPWQELCKKNQTELRILPLESNGRLSSKTLDTLVDSHTKLVAINHISNTLGRINPIEELLKVCKKRNTPTLIDAAQSAGLHQLSVEALGCDFLAFSGHKLFGPMGTGVLYASDAHKNEIEPLIVGGGIIKSVSLDASSYRSFPYNLEAGTPNVQGVLGLGAAIDFLRGLDRNEAIKHISQLAKKLVDGFGDLPQVKVLPYFDPESGIVSFNVGNIHSHDVAGYLNRDNIAVRAGTHCTQPLLDELKLDATVRISFSIYNTEEEVDRVLTSLRNLIEFWK